MKKKHSLSFEEYFHYRKVGRSAALIFHALMMSTINVPWIFYPSKASLVETLFAHPAWPIFATSYGVTLFVYILVFRRIPFESIAVNASLSLATHGFLESVWDLAKSIVNGVLAPYVGVAINNAPTTAQSESTKREKDAMQFYESLAVESRDLAKTIMLRSQVYLFVGCILALAGLAFFYIESNHLFRLSSETIAASLEKRSSPLNSEDTIYSLIKEFGPRVGILFFIEFVALFFLKQHRLTMDEFRYYEQIGRRREETVALLKFANEIEGFNKTDLANLSIFQSNQVVLEKEQTTELLETKKLNKDEAELLSKMIDLLSIQKK